MSVRSSGVRISDSGCVPTDGISPTSVKLSVSTILTLPSSRIDTKSCSPSCVGNTSLGPEFGTVPSVRLARRRPVRADSFVSRFTFSWGTKIRRSSGDALGACASGPGARARCMLANLERARVDDGDAVRAKEADIDRFSVMAGFDVVRPDGRRRTESSRSARALTSTVPETVLSVSLVMNARRKRREMAMSCAPTPSGNSDTTGSPVSASKTVRSPAVPGPAAGSRLITHTVSSESWSLPPPVQQKGLPGHSRRSRRTLARVRPQYRRLHIGSSLAADTRRVMTA